MPGLFDALKKMPKRAPKKFFVTVEGQQHEVTHAKKLWARQYGEQNLMLRDGEIVVKPTLNPKTQYSTLKKSSKGYFFQDGDIHWPNNIGEGGVTWQIERE